MNSNSNDTDIPKFHETFIPILEVLKDGKSRHYSDLRTEVRDKYYSGLPHELLAQKTNDGTQLILNRIGWAKSYLKEAGFLSYPERGFVQITNKGQDTLKRGSLTLHEVKKDPDFIATQSNKIKPTPKQDVNEETSPEETVESAINIIENEVKNELLEKLKAGDPYYFEHIVNDLFARMGYGGAESTAKSGDFGIDGVINQDELGLERIYVQAKRYNDHNVRELDIRNFIGAMSGDTQKGIFVTTAAFDTKAIQKAKEAHHKIILIDGEKLVDLMYKFGIGVQVKTQYEVKELDEDYFLK